MVKLFDMAVALANTKRRWLRRLLMTLLLALLVGVMTVGSWLEFEFLTFDLHHFQRTVRVGMTAEQVEADVGPPLEKLQSGQPLRPWGGGGPAKRVATETWIILPGALFLADFYPGPTSVLGSA
jgi:hypothetical protein